MNFQFCALSFFLFLIGNIAKVNSVFASNTSSLSIADLAMASNRPTHVIGFHFFIPQIVKLVEVVKTEYVSINSDKYIFKVYDYIYVGSSFDIIIYTNQ